MIKRTLIISSVAFVMISAGESRAYRPLGTEDAGVAGKGVAQAEISWDYLSWGKNDDTLKDENDYLFVGIFGLTDNLELSAEIPYLVHHLKDGSSEEGMGDVNLVAKCLLLPEGDRYPAFTIKGVLKLDSGDYEKGLGSGDKDYSLFAVASKTIDRVTLHGHLGYTWTGKKKNDLIDIPLYGIAVDYAVSEPLHIIGELNGNRHPDNTTLKEDPRIALAGMTYKVSEKLTLDAAYRWGLSNSAPEWSTTIGVSATY